MLGGHARPRQSVEVREAPLRDSEERQNGDHLHVGWWTDTSNVVHDSETGH